MATVTGGEQSVEDEENWLDPTPVRDRVRSSLVSDALREERKVQVTRERFEKGNEEVEDQPSPQDKPRSFRPPLRTGPSGGLLDAEDNAEESEEEGLPRELKTSSSSGNKVTNANFHIGSEALDVEPSPTQADGKDRRMGSSTSDGSGSQSLSERRGKPLAVDTGKPQVHFQDDSNRRNGEEKSPTMVPMVSYCSEADIPLVIGMTPPVRLRMTSADNYSARSMMVEWCEAQGRMRSWNSSQDPLQNGWFEAEKLLPPHVTDIRVSFQVKGPHKRWDVGKVDRHKNCAWVTGEKEEIKFKFGDQSEPVDAVFELKGPPHRCFVHRAWNAAAETHEDWECWVDDDESRPPREDIPQTLRAADLAAAPQECPSLEVYFSLMTSRLCVAAAELITVHRETLTALIGLDSTCTSQWLSTNVGTTASAGLMVAAVPMTFVLPPVGLTLAVAGGVAGTAAMGGGSMQERWTMQRLRTQLSRDSWNAFTVASILSAWIEAGKALSKRVPVDTFEHRFNSADTTTEPGAQHARQGAAVAITTGAVVQDTALRTGVIAAASLGDEAAMILPVLGPAGLIVGAVLTTGIALHGWTQRRFSQQEVRAKIDELRSKILFFQCLIARLGQLDCSICLRRIGEDDQIRRCTKLLHCFHDSCLPEAAKPEEGQSPSSKPAIDEGCLCPKCGFPLNDMSSFKDVPDGFGACLEMVQEADRTASKTASSSSRFSTAEIRAKMTSMLPKSLPSISMPKLSGSKDEGPVYPQTDVGTKKMLTDGESKMWQLSRQVDRVDVLMRDQPLDEPEVQKVYGLLCECEAKKDELDGIKREMLEEGSSAEGVSQDLVVQIDAVLDMVQKTWHRFDQWKVTMELPMDHCRDMQAAASERRMESDEEVDEAKPNAKQPPKRTTSGDSVGEAGATRLGRLRLMGGTTAAAMGNKLTGMKGAFAEKAASAKQGMLSSMTRKKETEATPLKEGEAPLPDEGGSASPSSNEGKASDDATPMFGNAVETLETNTLQRVEFLLDALSSIFVETKPAESLVQEAENHMKECLASKQALQELSEEQPDDVAMVTKIDDTLERIDAFSSKFDAWKASAQAAAASGGAVASAFSKMRGYRDMISQAMLSKAKPKDTSPTAAAEAQSTKEASSEAAEGQQRA